MKKKNVVIIISLIFASYLIAMMPFHKLESIDNELYYKFEEGFMIGSAESIPDAEIYCIELFYTVKNWEVLYVYFNDDVHDSTREWMEDMLIKHLEWSLRTELNRNNKFIQFES